MRWFLIPLIIGSALPLIAELPTGYGILYLSQRASPEVAVAVNHLADFLEVDFGSRPKIHRRPLFGNPSGIHIGPRPLHEAFDEDPLTDEVMVERSGIGIEISGTDNSATCFAVYRFIEEFLGWRYYRPGPLGLERLDEIPAIPETLGEPAVLLSERAGYAGRNLSGLGSNDGGPDWRAWHGLRERFVYNHTLHRNLPPTLFDSHPEWFGKDAQGKPKRPPYPKAHGYNDHPDLSHPEVRNWVVQKTTRALAQSSAHGAGMVPNVYPPVRQSPGIVSTSLSLGDSFVFGHFPESYPWTPPGYFRRWPDWSNHVFDYSNALAERITEAWEQSPWPVGKRPKLYLGTLAYLNWENIPDFEVHPSIVPYLTFDRSQWYDASAKEDDLALVSRWAKASPEVLGTWDYLFGYGFLMPRSMTSIVADSIPALHKRGIRAYFSQIAAIWPYDAHTNWLTARLLWNPDAESSRLVDEFFQEYYGAGARSMRAFFGTAESVWMQQSGSGWWLRYWKDPWQAALWTEPILEKMETELAMALSATARTSDTQSSDYLKHDRHHERIEQTNRIFGLTRQFLEFQTLCWDLQSTDWEKAGPSGLKTGISNARKALAMRARLIETTSTTTRTLPGSSRAGDLSWIFRYDSLGASMAAISLRMERLKSGAAAASGVLELLEDWNRVQGAGDSLKMRKPRSVLKDEVFADIADDRIWHHQFMDSEEARILDQEAGTGFSVKNIRRGHITQYFKVKPSHFYLGQLDLKSLQSPTGEVYIQLDFYNESRELIKESARGRIAPTDRYGAKQRVRAFAQAPEKTAYGRIKIRFYEMDQGSRADLYRVQILDLGVPANP